MDEHFINIEEVSRKLDNLFNKENKDIKTIFRNFNTNDWKNWLEDILTHGIAYPISNFSGGGDVVVDMVDYLNKNDIPTFKYEEALSEILSSIAFSFSNVEFLESILNALITVGGNKSNSILLKILQSRKNNYQKGKYDYIKSLSLLALARSSNLQTHDKKEVLSYLLLVGFKEMIHDPSFYSFALRFTYLHYTVKNFFQLLTIIINTLNNEISTVGKPTPDKEIIVSSILELIEELHYRKPSNFFSEIVNWIMFCYTDNDFHKTLKDNKLFKEVLCKINELSVNKYIGGFKHDYLNTVSDEQEFSHAFSFILDVLFEQKYSGFSIDENLHINAFLLNKDMSLSEKFLRNVLIQHNNYACRNFDYFPTVAFDILNHDYTINVISKLVEIYDEILYQPWDEKLGEIETFIKKTGFTSNNMIYNNEVQKIKKMLSGLSDGMEYTNIIGYQSMKHGYAIQR